MNFEKGVLRIDYDDDALNIIAGVNEALEAHGLVFVDDNKEHDGFCLFTLRKMAAVPAAAIDPTVRPSCGDLGPLTEFDLELLRRNVCAPDAPRAEGIVRTGRLQRHLRERGHFVKWIDGIWGPDVDALVAKAGLTLTPEEVRARDAARPF